MSLRTPLSLLVAGLLNGLLACAPPPLPEETANPDADQASIRILFPNPLYLDAERLCEDIVGDCPVMCPTFAVVVDVDNFVLDPDHYGDDPIFGEGHWHLHVDDPEFTAAARAAETQPWATLTSPLEEGFHVIGALLVQNNHFPLAAEDRGEDRTVVEIEVRDTYYCLSVPFGDGTVGTDTGR